MKNLLLLASVILAFSCSSDDGGKEKTCNCIKTIYEYNENMDVFEATGSEYYGDDCDDDQSDKGISTDSSGVHYRIVCE